MRLPRLAFAAVLVLGAVRLVNGVVLGRPVTYLAVLLVLTVVLGRRLARPPAQTPRGQAALRRVRELGKSAGPDAVSVAGGASSAPLGVAAVAMFGMSELADPTLREALVRSSTGGWYFGAVRPRPAAPRRAAAAAVGGRGG